MAKPIYADYTNHMLRFYCKNCKPENSLKLELKKEVDRKNWRAVREVLHRLSKEDRDVIIDVYSRGDTLSDNIYTVSKERCIDQDKIWIIVSKVTNQIAKERMLI